jgi:hypothetical protein
MGNPFSTRHTRPGAIPFRFADGESPDAMVEKLRGNGWLGQILGPHGSGKSTLVAALLPALEAAGKSPLLIELHDGQRRLPVRLRSLAQRPETIVIVDGYEQLARWNRYRLKAFCRRRALGLLVTSHDSVGLPDLYRTTTSPELAERLVHTLLDGRSFPLSSEDLGTRLAAHGGDLRELLFELYDLYEARREGPARQ